MDRKLRRNGAGRKGRRGIPSRGPGSVAPLTPALCTGGTVLLVGTVLVLWTWPDAVPYRTVAAGPGHGRGMSQLGAFANAQAGWAAESILDHYYPGAELGTIPRTLVRVRLTAQDGASLDTYADAGLRVAGRIVAPGEVAHLTPLPDGRANVVVTLGCDGEVRWQESTDDPFAYPLDPGPDRPAAEHLTLCGGGAYRGALGVALEDGEARTVDLVDVDDYLRGVVPAEMQANWADDGGAAALRAQAIAARSYALAEHRYPYAQTCDTTDCQFYPGTEKEDPRATAAVAETSGTVLLRDGRILRAEYSAAPGGGHPADIDTFAVGPAPSELVPAPAPHEPATDPMDPRRRTAVAESPIDIEYRRIGGPNSAVGQPIGPEMQLPEHAGTYRMFTNGVIIATPTLGAQVVDFTTLLQLVPDPNTGTPAPETPAPQDSSAPPADSFASNPAHGAPADASVPPGNTVPHNRAVPPANSAVPGGGPGSAVPRDGSVPPANSAAPNSLPDNGIPQNRAVPPANSVAPDGAPGSGVRQDRSAPPDTAPGSVVPRDHAVPPVNSPVPNGLPDGGIPQNRAITPAERGAPGSGIPQNRSVPPADSAAPNGLPGSGLSQNRSVPPANSAAPDGASGGPAARDGSLPPSDATPADPALNPETELPHDGSAPSASHGVPDVGPGIDAEAPSPDAAPGGYNESASDTPSEDVIAPESEPMAAGSVEPVGLYVPLCDSGGLVATVAPSLAPGTSEAAPPASVAPQQSVVPAPATIPPSTASTPTPPPTNAPVIPSGRTATS
ncbi:SpoIID/LytB domain-containing protein [Nocardia sp. NPDC052566]|uniref:SpoIID/LytB domain-containing protein n=1 Tax=Nocardia sp. NPDC052566 TaxID=3364330 RepID=UPI0037CB9796